MTVVYAIPETVFASSSSSSQYVTLQVIEGVEGSSAMVDSEEMDGLQEVATVLTSALNMCITDDLEEADCVNDGVICIVSDPDHPWKPLPVRFVYDDCKVIPNSIQCRNVSSFKEAGWNKDATQEDKVKLFQARPDEYSDWLPRRESRVSRKLFNPPRFFKTLQPLAVTASISRKSITLCRIPRMSILRCNSMVQLEERGVVRTRVKLVGHSTSNPDALRVHDYIFGSDGWVDFCIGEQSDRGNSSEYQSLAEWITFNAPPPPMFLKPGPGPHTFNAWKVVDDDEAGLLKMFVEKKPKYRHFEVKDGRLSYYENEAEYMCGGLPLKNRFIELRNVTVTQCLMASQGSSVNPKTMKFFSSLEGSESIAKDKYSVVTLKWDPENDPYCKGNPKKAFMFLIVDTDVSYTSTNCLALGGATTEKSLRLAAGEYV